MNKAGRFEIRDKLGEGGMGVVHRAFDHELGREVTLKTIKNPQDKSALDLFKRECAVLASLAHPNIVEIYDVGEIEEPGGRRPYFVMPLLRGETLESLIKSSSTRLSIERCIQIASQICGGLQAAHAKNLVHRDLKPSNIFILENDFVKIIDFGVAHLIDQNTATGLKGSLPYMSPEQLAMKQPSPLSDQFSVGVVCYEMLTRRHPFKVSGYNDLADAIVNHFPAPMSEVNQAVSTAISQVVHKSLAKQPFHRFANIQELGECLQKAHLNQSIEIFNPAKIEPRLDRVRKAIADGDLEFADEIIRELQSESYLSPEIDQIRRQIDQMRVSKQIDQLLAMANRRMEEQEYILALQKVQEVIEIDPFNTPAFTLRAAIETKKSSAHSEGALRLAHQHLENRSYDLARQAVEKVLQLRPQDARAQALLVEINKRELESGRIRQEKERAYQAALQSFAQGDVSAALSKIERLLDLDRRAPEGTKPEQSEAYQALYAEVRSKREFLDKQYSEAKRRAADGDAAGAVTICAEVLKEYPNNVVFQALTLDIEEAQREQISSYIANVERQVAAEPDLGRKVSLLEEAAQRYPSEERFRQALGRYRSRRDLVQSIAAKAAGFEDIGQFSDALSQWEIMRTTNPQYPGLEIEIERLNRRRDQQRRAESKSQWIVQIDQALGLSDFVRAETLAGQALEDFENDPELAALKKRAALGVGRAEEARQTLVMGQEFLSLGETEKGFSALREALRLDPSNHSARTALVEALLVRARSLLDADWAAAEPLVNEALELDGGNALAKSLRTLIKDNRESEETVLALSKARELQSNGDINGAIDVVDQALIQYPGRERLAQLRSMLIASLPENEREYVRSKDLEMLKSLVKLSQTVGDPKQRDLIIAQTRHYSSYSNDSEFSQALATIYGQTEKQGRSTLESELPPANAGPAGNKHWYSGISVSLAPAARIFRSSLSPRLQFLRSPLALGVLCLVLFSGAAGFYFLIPRNFPPEQFDSVAIVQVPRTDLLEQPASDAKHLLEVSRGTKVNVLRPVLLDQTFIRVQFVSAQKNSPPGYVKRDDLGEWSNPKLAWELLTRLQPEEGADKSRQRQYAQQLQEFSARYSGTDQAEESELERAGIHLSLAEAMKKAGKPTEEWAGDLNSAKKILASLRQPNSSEALLLGQRVADLEEPEVKETPTPHKDARQLLIEKAYRYYAAGDLDGVLAVADQLDSIDKAQANRFRQLVEEIKAFH